MIDARGDQYSLPQRLHLIRCLGEWGASLYAWSRLTWDSANAPAGESVLFECTALAAACRAAGVEFWAGVHPGDRRYTMHESDRALTIANLRAFQECGASGVVLLFDDMHPGGEVRAADAPSQGVLIHEAQVATGALRAICGEQYHGSALSETAYWEPLLASLPRTTSIAWTGPRVWNARISPQDFPETDWPLLFWDNYFASDSDDPLRAPIYPYEGRDKELAAHLPVVLVNPSNQYPWQFCALRTAMQFFADPQSYSPECAFKAAVRELGERYWRSIDSTGG